METAERPDRRAVFVAQTGRRITVRQIQNVVGAFLKGIADDAGCPPTPCATPLRPTCWTRARTCWP
jgi:hypothetical protein